mmetsp:Transcript_25220/g.81586  ORF Transcript_25220/g.81586 Transcript_25220/m.81586 type:complete len:315 (-) Transcript_25220:636-1580(-)
MVRSARPSLPRPLLLLRLATLGDSLLGRLRLALAFGCSPLCSFGALGFAGRAAGPRSLDGRPFWQLAGDLVVRFREDERVGHPAGDLRYLQLLEVVALLGPRRRLLLPLTVAELATRALRAPRNDAGVRRDDGVRRPASESREVPPPQVVLHLRVHPRVLRGRLDTPPHVKGRLASVRDGAGAEHRIADCGGVRGAARNGDGSHLRQLRWHVDILLIPVAEPAIASAAPGEAPPLVVERGAVLRPGCRGDHSSVGQLEDLLRGRLHHVGHLDGAVGLVVGAIRAVAQNAELGRPERPQRPGPIDDQVEGSARHR